MESPCHLTSSVKISTIETGKLQWSRTERYYVHKGTLKPIFRNNFLARIWLNHSVSPIESKYAYHIQRTFCPSLGITTLLLKHKGRPFLLLITESRLGSYFVESGSLMYVLGSYEVKLSNEITQHFDSTRLHSNSIVLLNSWISIPEHVLPKTALKFWVTPKSTDLSVKARGGQQQARLLNLAYQPFDRLLFAYFNN